MKNLLVKDPLHRIPASTPTAKSLKLAFSLSDRRYLAQRTAHLATVKEGLFIQGGLDLFYVL
jgi:hypothetical protein